MSCISPQGFHFAVNVSLVRHSVPGVFTFCPGADFALLTPGSHQDRIMLRQGRERG